MDDTATPFTASFVIFKRAGKVAFVLRENTSWMNGYYGLASGKVEKNESFLSCAIREAKEEVGVTLGPENLEYVHTLHRKSDDSEWVDVFFEAKNWKEEPFNAEPHMHKELAWLDLAKLPDNVYLLLNMRLSRLKKERPTANMAGSSSMKTGLSLVLAVVLVRLL